MNLLLDTLHKFHCRSTHQKLVLDALNQLSVDNAKRWRDVMLKHFEPLLRGAVDPDVKFQDFHNHAVAPSGSLTCGAPIAAREWYDRLVESLREQRWRHAAYHAGVLSHYYTDPLQPFHAAPTEAAGVIHQALERSVRQSYDRLRATAQLRGLVKPTVPQAENWLERMVADGASASRPHCQTLATQYNARLGRKNPSRALNLMCREVLAPLLGHAIAGTALIFDRAFEEADVQPPRVTLIAETMFAGGEIPAQVAAQKLADQREAKEIQATFRELQRTAKAEQHLPPEVFGIRETLGYEATGTQAEAA